MHGLGDPQHIFGSRNAARSCPKLWSLQQQLLQGMAILQVVESSSATRDIVLKHPVHVCAGLC